MNPYNHPSPPPPPRPPDFRPLRRRKRVWAGAIGLLFAGVLIGTTGEQPDDTQALSDGAKPTATITATVEATATELVTVTPKPEPAVTKTKTVKKPGPTVTVTSPGGAGTSGGSGTSGGTGGSGSTGGSSGGGGGGAANCSIKSNAGNCYSPGQFCRNSDHGASTTTATGERITCRQSGNAWRWTR